MSKSTCLAKWVFFKLSLFLINLNLHFSLPENHFGDCLPKQCGDMNITYPFHIIEQQKSYCGYPGFEVSCSDSKLAYFNISGATYVIKSISYEEQTFRVVNSLVLESLVSKRESCFGSLQHVNLTLNDGVFSYATNYSDIILLLNCPNGILMEKSMQRMVICGALAVYENDSKLGGLEGKCNGTVTVVPYEGGNEGVSNIRNVLQQGFQLKWTANDCSPCIETGGQCGYDQKVNEYGCYCPSRTHVYHCVHDPVLHKKRSLPLVLGLGIGGFILMVIALMAIWYCRKLKFALLKFEARTVSLERSGSEIEKGSVFFGVPLFSYSELQEATDNFDQSRELGDGGFGTVYYGKLRDGREVAVKRLYEKNYRRVEQFMNEVQILTCLRHRNLVSLYGCTSHHSKELLLVYEFVHNGTVADQLYGEKAKNGSLPWPVRLRIAIETASALCYLHASDIIHRDVKTHNILLDSNFSVKVADFGLSRLFPNHVTHVSTAPQGTPGYLDPEYHQCYQLTDKSDVYSFGVVLVELISSLPAVDMSRHRHEINLSNYAMTRIQRCAFDELIDPRLGFLSDFKVMRMTTAVGELAFQCLQHEKEFRPSMNEILDVLQRIESTNYDALQAEELVRNNAGVLGTDLPPSTIEDDHAKLLSKHPHPLHPSSPNCVMDEWPSKSTTPSSSK